MAVFICYISLKHPFKIHILPLQVIVGESNGRYIFECVLNLLTFITLRNGKVEYKKFESF